MKEQQVPGSVTADFVGVKDTEPCPTCKGRGSRRSFQPLLWLAISLACFVWFFLAVTDFKHFWPKGKSVESFVFALFLGPFMMYGFISRAALRRDGWSAQCSRCRGTGRC